MKPKIVFIGASTGGPTLIKELLSSLEHLSCTIVIAQHMREEVLPSFIHELTNATRFPLYATPTELDFTQPSIIICSSSVVFAKRNNHISLEKESTNQKFTPDIDKLLSSFLPYTESFDVEAIIMTGMGSDGVEGARVLKSHGAKVSAQDEKSSPLYGMPRVAKESGVAENIYSFEEIKSYLGAI